MPWSILPMYKKVYSWVYYKKQSRLRMHRCKKGSTSAAGVGFPPPLHVALLNLEVASNRTISDPRSIAPIRGIVYFAEIVGGPWEAFLRGRRHGCGSRPVSVHWPFECRGCIAGERECPG